MAKNKVVTVADPGLTKRELWRRKYMAPYMRDYRARKRAEKAVSEARRDMEDMEDFLNDLERSGDMGNYLKSKEKKTK